MEFNWIWWKVGYNLFFPELISVQHPLFNTPSFSQGRPSLPSGLSSAPPIILPPYPLPMGDNPRPTVPCDCQGAQQSQLELGIGAGTGRPREYGVAWSWPGTGTGPQSPGVSFLGTLHTDTSEGHFLFWPRAVKVEAWNYQQPHLRFLQQQKGSPLATGENGTNPEKEAKSGR